MAVTAAGSPVGGSPDGGRDDLESFARTVLAGESRLEERDDGSLAGPASPVELSLQGLSFPPRDLDQTLPQQILLLRVAQRAVAGLHSELPRERTAVLAGMGCDAEIARWGVRWRLAEELEGEALRRARDGVVPELRAEGVVGTMPNMVANRINRQLGLGGASASVSAEERSGVVALELAVRALAAGEIDAAVVAAVDLSCEPVHEAAVRSLLPESRQVPGDAAVALVVKRLEDARRDGDRVLAILGEGAEEPAETDLRLALDPEDGAVSLTPLVGHAHAASGLLHVAAAVVACHYRARPFTPRAGLSEPRPLTPPAPLSLPGPPRPPPPARERGEKSKALRPSKAGRPCPWLASETRLGVVTVEALGGQSSTVFVAEDRDAAPGSLAPAGGFPQIFLVSGEDRADVRARLREGRWSPPGESSGGPARLALVAADRRQLDARRAEAGRLLAGDAGATTGNGIFYRDRPLDGELAFVFPGAAAAYPGMGRELLLAMPQLLDRLGQRMSDMRLAAGWVYDPERSRRPLTPLDKLWGCSFLCQAHAELSQGLLGLRPAATLGYSSGESNALLALGAWNDLDELHRDTRDGGLFDVELGGEMRAIGRAWGGAGKWSSWLLRAPAKRVREAVAGEARVHLTHVNSPGEVVIGGEEEGCRRLIGRLGADAVPLDFDLAVHCPEVSEVAEAWLELHRRPTREVPGVRFYTCDGIRSFHPTREEAARAILGQALSTVDFPALVRRAWDDGVRIFVEHGPRDLLSGWIRDTLRLEGVGDDEVLAVAFDRAGSCGARRAATAAARLLAAGVEVDVSVFSGRWAAESREKPAGPSVTLASHWPPVRLAAGAPTLAELLAVETVETEDGPAQVMAPAPPLPPVLGEPQISPPAPQGALRLENEIPVAVPEPVPAVASTVPAPAVEQMAAAVPAAAAALAVPAAAPPPPAPARRPHPVPVAAAAELHARVVAAQQEFLRGQVEVHRRFLEWRRREQDRLLRMVGETPHPPTPSPIRSPPPGRGGAPSLPEGKPIPAIPVGASVEPPVDTVGPAAAGVSVGQAPPYESSVVEASTPVPAAAELPGPKWSRADLEVLARGKISSVFGPLFTRQDGYERQVRMPAPPFLFADRVTGLDAEPGSMGTGTIWTETDVDEDSWFLDRRHMAPGLMIEAGQADLLLISWLGIDFHNRGQRVYRLLGCELTYRGSLPRPGDTLCYEIHVDGHAREGEVRLFFFHYDCVLKGSGETRLEVRSGQAGFFTDEELAESAGVLWDPAASAPVGERRDPPAVAGSRRRFSREQLVAASEGRVFECLGPGFELAASHTLTPTIQGGRMLLLDRVTDLDPTGGPWGRGYLRAAADISPDAWYFAGHFHNDPCMPGTLMFEVCLQTMAFYLMAMGFTLGRDGWRFEPVPDASYRMRCRGQVDPRSRELVYEVFVHEVVAAPVPTLWADLLCTVDGLKAFHAERVGLRLVPDWPLETRPELAELPKTPHPLTPSPTRSRPPGEGAPPPSPEPHESLPSMGRKAVRVDGFAFDYDSLLACAWGRPSRAFGAMYRPFDGPRTVPRLPGPPYHFMSRVVAIDGEMGAFRHGATIEVEYDVPPEAWYFAENGGATMPFAVLMEAGLQPCGWLASFIGSALTTDVDLKFRNLDGTGTLRAEVGPQSGILTSRVRLTATSSSAGVIIVRFAVEMEGGAPWGAGGETSSRPVFDMETAFGFFPAAAMEHQAGLPASEEERERLRQPSDFLVDLTGRPERDGAPTLRLAGPRLLMLDRVTGFWPEGGRAGLGRLRAEKDVDPGEWFFKAHFFQDPVQPGSLGIEAMVQLLQFYMLHRGLGADVPNPRFEPIACDRPLTWKYRGQVVPSDGVITTELEVVEAGRDDAGAYAVADAWLWIDGKRIYSATGLGMRIVEGAPPPLPQPPAVEEVLDPERDPWVADHCPTWTVPALPMMSVVERLAVAARAARPDLVVVAVEDVVMRRWIAFDRGPVRLRAEIVETTREAERQVLTIELSTAAAGSDLTLAARGRVVLAPAYPPAPAALEPLADGEEIADPYASGSLFHGPDFQLLRRLRLGERGSTAILDAGAGAAPRGALHQALLDAAIHGIPHDDLRRWLPEAPADVAAYPRRLVAARFFGPTPTAGEVRAEARVAEASGPLPTFRLQLVADGRTWAELLLEEVLLSKGPLGTATPGDRRAFLRDRVAVPGLGISRSDGETTRLRPSEVAASDWLPGSVARVYGLDAGADRRTEAREVAVRDHVARRAGVHPSRMSLDFSPPAPQGSVQGDNGGAVAVPAQMPLNRFPVRIAAADGGEIAVRDAAPPHLDAEPLWRFWRRYLGIGRWPVEDLFVGLAERFIRRVVVADPEALEAYRGRPVLYLGNHQVMIESLLFSVVAAALGELSTITLARADHRESWVGHLVGHSFAYPGVENPGVVTFIERRDMASGPAVVEYLGGILKGGDRSVMVHCEGTRSLTCRQPVRSLSGAFLDAAMAAGAAVVPVRFAGGLPVEPLPERIEFPFGCGRQDFWIGRPLTPGELAELDYRQRREAVMAAINDLGPRAEEEVPLPGDPDFGAAVEAWHLETGATPAYALVYRVLEAVADPCPAVRRLQEAAGSGRLAVGDGPEERWLAELARQLFGERGPKVVAED